MRRGDRGYANHRVSCARPQFTTDSPARRASPLDTMRPSNSAEERMARGGLPSRIRARSAEQLCGGDHEDAGHWATRDRCARREDGSLDAGRLSFLIRDQSHSGRHPLTQSTPFATTLPVTTV